MNLDFLDRREERVQVAFLRETEEGIKKLVQILESLHIFDKDIQKDIICGTNKKIVTNILRFIDEKIISASFVEQHPSIFINSERETPNYQMFRQNMQIFEEAGFPLQLFLNNCDIYLERPGKLKYNLLMLDMYHLLDSIYTTKDFSFFKTVGTKNKIESFLELGYEKLLEKDLSPLKSDIQRHQRLRILKKENIRIETSEEILQVLENPIFPVEDTELDSYVFNKLHYRVWNASTVECQSSSFQIGEKVEQELEKLPQTMRVYQIGNLSFSKEKLKRSYQRIADFPCSIEEKTLYTLTADTFLTEEEFLKVKEAICPNQECMIGFRRQKRKFY